jgi:hypothetical protein
VSSSCCGIRGFISETGRPLLEIIIRIVKVGLLNAFKQGVEVGSKVSVLNQSEVIISLADGRSAGFCRINE